MSIRFQTESTEKDLNLIDRISIFHEEIDYQKRNEITGKYELVHTETLEVAREKY